MKRPIIALSLGLSVFMGAASYAADCPSLFSPIAEEAKTLSSTEKKLSDELSTRLAALSDKDKIFSAVLLVRRNAVTRITNDLKLAAVANVPSGDRLGFTQTIYAGDLALLSPRFVSKAMLLKLLERKTVLKAIIESHGYLDRLALLPETSMLEGATVMFVEEADAEIAKQVIQSYGGTVLDYFGTTFHVTIPAGSLLKLRKLPNVEAISF